MENGYFPKVTTNVLGVCFAQSKAGTLSISFPRAAAATIPTVASVATITRRSRHTVADVTSQDAVSINTTPPALTALVDEHGHGADTGAGGDGEEAEQREANAVVSDAQDRAAHHARQDGAVDPADVERQNDGFVSDDLRALERRARRHVGQ